MYGLATDGLATLVDGLGSTTPPPGLVKLLRADRAPGLDMDRLRLSWSSSGGVCTSPMLPQLPKLSSDWLPSLPSPDSMYRIHFFLRLQKDTKVMRESWECERKILCYGTCGLKIKTSNKNCYVSMPCVVVNNAERKKRWKHLIITYKKK